MIDCATQERVVVYSAENAAPYIMVTYAQLEPIVAALKKNGLEHWVEDDVISVNGSEEVAFVVLSRNVNVSAVQAMLDDLA